MAIAAAVSSFEAAGRGPCQEGGVLLLLPSIPGVIDPSISVKALPNARWSCSDSTRRPLASSEYHIAPPVAGTFLSQAFCELA